jgi:hypothetical protein
MPILAGLLLLAELLLMLSLLLGKLLPTLHFLAAVAAGNAAVLQMLLAWMLLAELQLPQLTQLQLLLLVGSRWQDCCRCLADAHAAAVADAGGEPLAGLLSLLG